MHTYGSPHTPETLTEFTAARALLQAIPLGICTVDPAGHILSLNTEAERLSPHTLGSNLGQCYNLSQYLSRRQTWQTALTLLPAFHSKVGNACCPLT